MRSQLEARHWLTGHTTVLLQTLGIAFAEVEAADHGIDTDHVGNIFRDNLLGEIGSAQPGAQITRKPGAELVDAAWEQLRKLHQPLQHRIRKPAGIFGTIINHIWQAVPTLHVTAPSAEPSSSTLGDPLAKAFKLLRESAQKNNSDALYLIAELNYYGNFSHPKNLATALDHYQRLALLNGNSSALYTLGLMHSTGVGGVVERDQARALLYYTAAANQGHTRAEMTLAHRQYSGIGTPKSCDNAVKYYKRVADKAVAWYRSGPPGGMSWISEAYRIVDKTGGVYGEGASVSSAGQNAMRAHPNSDAYASIEDIIEYLDLMSQKGDFKASFNLGRIYYDGQRGLDRDLDLATKYFVMVTQRYWKKGRIVENPKPGLDKTACKAAGFIGRMLMRGEGIEQNFERAKFWFERGMSAGDAHSQYGMGLMLLHGYGVQRNIPKATSLFKAAADNDYAPAQVQLGALYLDQGHADDLGAANHYFELAGRYANIEAYYYLAELSLHGVGRDKSCNTAVTYYKAVAEKAEPLVSSWAEANIAYEEGDKELAFLEYLGSAEQGYERAQNNVAHLLDPAQSALPLPYWLGRPVKKSRILQNPGLALVYWTRSAMQGNIDSMVKMGDYFLQGIGTDLDVDKAVQCYTGASEYHQSAQALYNLGWMHENGVGLTQDYHLAKRFYDSALETNDEAYLPVALSLLKLRAKSAWNTLTHGRINSIQDELVKNKDWSLSEWIANFLQDDSQYYDALYEYEDPMPGADSDLGAIDDDNVLESLIIVGLAAGLIFLILYRQQRLQAARRREEEDRQQQQQEQQQQEAAAQDQLAAGHAAPGAPAGDAAFGQWGVGGVGH